MPCQGSSVVVLGRRVVVVVVVVGFCVVRLLCQMLLLLLWWWLPMELPIALPMPAPMPVPKMDGLGAFGGLSLIMMMVGLLGGGGGTVNAGETSHLSRKHTLNLFLPKVIGNHRHMSFFPKNISISRLILIFLAFRLW